MIAPNLYTGLLMGLVLIIIIAGLLWRIKLAWMSALLLSALAAFAIMSFKPVYIVICVTSIGLYYILGRLTWLRPGQPRQTDIGTLDDLMTIGEDLRPDNILAYAGDKCLYRAPGNIAALAYSDIGGSRIVMGPPIGPRAAWKPTLETFAQDTKARGLTPAIYAVPPDLCQDLQDIGFWTEKIGENAILTLEEFSLSGNKRELMRRSHRKLAERYKASFELSSPPHNLETIEMLRTISNHWLEQKGTQEKSFSLGRFDPNFLDQCPIGIAKLDGETVAFVTLLVTPDKGWAGVDLIRYNPEKAVTNTTDFLLVELILWAKQAGYDRFDLAMAPLSGLHNEGPQSLSARIGHFIYKKGGRFYNFQGLRRFKQKYNPDWEPRYIATPTKWAIPITLARVAILTNGIPKYKRTIRPPQ